MKLFPDSDTKKRFMKTGLPVMLGIAWAPIIWMATIATIGPVLFALTGSWTVAHALVLIVVLLVSYLLLKVFVRIGDRFYGGGR